MAMELLRFSSFEEFLRHLSSQIEKTRAQLSEHLRRYNEIKDRAERLRSIEERLAKALGVKLEPVNEIDLKGLKLVVGARPTDEAQVLMEVIQSLRNKLEVLMKLQKLVEDVAKNLQEISGMILLVETVNDIPVKILLCETK